MVSCTKLSVLIVSVLALCGAEKCKDCPTSTLGQHGARFVRDVLEQFAPEESSDVVRLTDGVEVVEVVPLGEARANGARSIPQNEPLLSRLARYLESHELKIKLNSLMPGPQIKKLLTETYKELEQDKSLGGETFLYTYMCVVL